MGLLYERTGRLNTKTGGFRPAEIRKAFAGLGFEPPRAVHSFQRTLHIFY